MATPNHTSYSYIFCEVEFTVKDYLIHHFYCFKIIDLKKQILKAIMPDHVLDDALEHKWDTFKISMGILSQ